MSDSPDVRMGSPPPPVNAVSSSSSASSPDMVIKPEPSIIDLTSSLDSGLSDSEHEHEEHDAVDKSSLLLPVPTPAPVASASSSKPVSKAAKPKSTKAPKARSPSPTPPPPPVPLQTVRLTITLGGPSNYEVNVLQLAKETGQRPPSPPPKPEAGDSSESEGEEDDGHEQEKAPDAGAEAEAPTGVVKRRKRKQLGEYYDVTDPFIDDSELAIDERTFFAQTKQQGFYVSSGEVALARDRGPSPKKSNKSSRPSLSMSFHLPTLAREHPASDTDDPGSISAPLPASHSNSHSSERVGQKRKRYMTITENGKKRKIIDTNSFHPDLQLAIDELKKRVAQETWDQKGKFPPAIKPHLAALALKAIRLNEYDEHFFNLMPVLFPYNKFTMSKLIKRMIFDDHVQILQERISELLVELEAAAKAGFPKAEEEWQKSVQTWEKRHKEKEAGGGAPEEETPKPAVAEEEAMDVDGEKPEPATKHVGDQPPPKRYRLTDALKAIVWDLVLLSNKCCELENEKNLLENSNVSVSEQGLRKALYQKIVAAFPDGWVNSGQISRDVSVIKKRIEKEQQERAAE